jgi:pyruvate/2-oxoglutarate/acetoin dehydrogenase E1 component
MQRETARSGTIEITYREAVKQAIRDAINRDERVFLMGEDVGRYGGCYAVSKGLLAEFGPEKIRDTPLSESGFTGAGIGAAMAGLRPIVEVMTVNFSLLALDQILNTAATVRHMSGNQFGVPLVIRMATGAGRQLAAQHSHSLEGWYAHIPGIKVLAPATLEDARGMLWTALEDPDPVLIFENVMLYNMNGKLAADAGAVDIAKAAVRQVGRDISLITYGGSLWKTLAAAETLLGEGIEAEVVDLRSLRPLDDSTIMASVEKTRRAVIIDEGWRSGSLAAEIGMRIVERAFWSLDAPIGRVCSEEVPIPGKDRSCRQGRAEQSVSEEKPWPSSACPRSVPTWRRARWSNGWSSPATRSSTATSSQWSRPKRAPSRLRPSKPAKSKSF